MGLCVEIFSFFLFCESVVMNVQLDDLLIQMEVDSFGFCLAGSLYCIDVHWLSCLFTLLCFSTCVGCALVQQNLAWTSFFFAVAIC